MYWRRTMTTRRSMPPGVEAAAGLGESVAITHGPYCSQFNDTLNVYLTAHNALGSSLHTAGVDLAKSLRIAAKIYSEADEAWRKAIDGLFT